MKPIATILTEIPDLAREALDTWGTNPISDDTKHGSPGPRVATGAVMPDYTLADLDRIVALHGGTDSEGLGALATWVRHVRDEMDESWWPIPDERTGTWWVVDSKGNTTHHEGLIAILCDWLTRSLDFCQGRGWEDEMHGDLRRLHGSLRHICRIRPDYYPRCRKCDNRVHLLDGQGRDATPETFAYGSCSGCGHTYPKGPAMDALGRIQDFTLAELADRVKVPLSTLHRWHKEGLIKPTGKSPAGKTFRVDDVMSAKLTMGRSAA